MSKRVLVRVAASLAVCLCAHAHGQTYELISQEPGGAPANNDSGFVSVKPGLNPSNPTDPDYPGRYHTIGGTTAVSADGRWVAFSSDADDLVAGDFNGRRDVFVRDRDTGTTVRVSILTSGGEADDHSGVYGLFGNPQTQRKPDRVDISDDGRFIVFTSLATNLVSGDTNGLPDVFLHDRDADEDGVYDEGGGQSTTVHLSSVLDPLLGGAHPMMSADGSTITFSELEDSTTIAGVRVVDQAGASLLYFNSAPNFFMSLPAISGDGHYAYSVQWGGMPGNYGLGYKVMNVWTGQTVVAQSFAGIAEMPYWFYEIVPSYDGRYAGVTYGSFFLLGDWELTVSRGYLGLPPEPYDNFWYTLGLERGWHACIDPTERFIAFESADSLLPEDTNTWADVYLWDRIKADRGDPALLLATSGTEVQANDDSRAPALSDHAVHGVLESDASNLITIDNNTSADVFLLNNPGGLRQGWGEIVFLLDDSGSMLDHTWNAVIDGLRSAITDNTIVPPNGMFSVAFVRCISYGDADHPLGWYYLTDNNAATECSDDLECLKIGPSCSIGRGDYDGTDFATGIYLATSLFETNDTLAFWQIAQLGDGEHVDGNDNPGLAAARDYAFANGTRWIDGHAFAAPALAAFGVAETYESYMTGPAPTIEPSYTHYGGTGGTDDAGLILAVAEYVRQVVCGGDVNRDGVVNTIDFIAFLNLWSVSAPGADFTGDGIVDTQDWISFLNYYNAPDCYPALESP